MLPTIKFTIEYKLEGRGVKVEWDDSKKQIRKKVWDLEESERESVNFLDTEVWIDESGFLQTDLYVKKCYRVNYLLSSSCHPGHITKNIPYSLVYRLKRICSRQEYFVKRLAELKENLIERKYTIKVIESAIARVNLISRDKALEKVSVNRKIFQRDHW